MFVRYFEKDDLADIPNRMETKLVKLPSSGEGCLAIDEGTIVECVNRKLKVVQECYMREWERAIGCKSRKAYHSAINWL